MARTHFDLRDEPWIPVRMVGSPAGAPPVAVGLRELLLRAHRVERLEVDPAPALSALYRVLYALTARVTGLDERGPGRRWGERRQAVADAGRLDPESVGAYFARYEDRFNLFDPVRPWMQDPRLAVQCDPAARGVDRLVVGRPAGSSHSWFEHVNPARPVLPDNGRAALDLLVWLYYGAAGRFATRSVLRAPAPARSTTQDPDVLGAAAVVALGEALEAATAALAVPAGEAAQRLRPLRRAVKAVRAAAVVLDTVLLPEQQRPRGVVITAAEAAARAAQAAGALCEALRALLCERAGDEHPAGLEALAAAAEEGQQAARMAAQCLDDAERHRAAARARTDLERTARSAVRSGTLAPDAAVIESDCAAGPLRATVSYHPEGPTLFTTLLAGLVMPGAQVRRTEDLCPWETPELGDPAGEPPPTAGPCSVLTARSQHAILLLPHHDGRHTAGARITWAWRQRVPSTQDPFLAWDISKEGHVFPRRAKAGRGLWRDVPTLLLDPGTGKDAPLPPAVLRTAQTLGAGLRIRALGFEQDLRAKDVQFVDEDSMLALLDMTERRAPALARQLAQLSRTGQAYGERLERAARKAWQLLTAAPKLPRTCTWAESAGLRYWPAAQEVFWRRARQRDFEGVEEEFRDLAERVFAEVTARATGRVRGAKAVERARGELSLPQRRTGKPGGHENGRPRQRGPVVAVLRAAALRRTQAQAAG